MTKKELINKLKALRINDDQELAHRNADDALLDFINDEKVTEAFKQIDKWYA